MPQCLPSNASQFSPNSSLPIASQCSKIVLSKSVPVVLWVISCQLLPSKESYLKWSCLRYFHVGHGLGSQGNPKQWKTKAVWLRDLPPSTYLSECKVLPTVLVAQTNISLDFLQYWSSSNEECLCEITSCFVISTCSCTSLSHRDDKLLGNIFLLNPVEHLTHPMVP